MFNIIASLNHEGIMSLTKKKYSYFNTHKEQIKMTFETIKDTNLIFANLTDEGFAYIILYVISLSFKHNL